MRPNVCHLAALAAALAAPQANAQFSLPALQTAIGETPDADDLDREYSICAGQPEGEDDVLSLNDFAGKVVMISTFYTGCAPGRFIAPGFTQFCNEQKLLHPGQFECITSLKGSSSCLSWTNTYMNLDGDTSTSDAGIPQVVQDSESALHYTFFDGNPQFAVLDHDHVLQTVFNDDTGLYVSEDLTFTSAAADLVAELVAGLPLTDDVIEADYIVDWFVNADGYAEMDAIVGETVRFSWDPAGYPHDVYIHPSGTCDADGSIFVGDVSGATAYTFTEADCGQVTFACDIYSSHCPGGQILTFNVGGCAEPEPSTVPTMTCAPSFGLQHAVQVEFSEEHGLQNPRDLQFHPLQPSQLWVANHDTDQMSMIDIAAGTSKTRKDHHAPYHYMEKITSMSFAPNGWFATCQDSLNAYNGMQAPNNFMGPTLYNSDEADLVDQLGNGGCDTTDPESTCFFSHQDMLHESPQCMGIAHDPETTTPFGNVYWVFDGHDGMLMRYDFQSPHGPGSLDHSVAAVRRYPDISLTRVEGVPGHIAMDPDERVLYIADTGGGRILRMNPDSGHFLRSAKVEFPVYTSMAETFEYSIWGCSDWEVFAEGIDVPSGLHVSGGVVYVAEWNTSTIIALDKATGQQISAIQTGSLGLNGFDIDQSGQLWFSDGPSNTVSRVLVEEACPVVDETPVVPVQFPAYECTDVVDDTIVPLVTEHAAGYMNLSAFIGISDYADAELHHCGGNSETLSAATAGMPTADEEGNYLINNDALLMSGYACHVCLPERCLNGGSCVHVPSGAGGVFNFLGELRNMSGFTCDCVGTGFSGDMCQTIGEIIEEVGGPGCAGDADWDLDVDVEDVLAVLTAFGMESETGDVTMNGVVDIEDILLVLSQWGEC